MKRYAVHFVPHNGDPKRVFLTYEPSPEKAQETVRGFLQSQGETRAGGFLVGEAGSFDYKTCDVLDESFLPVTWDSRVTFG